MNQDEEPVLRVVRGTPTAEELAALVGVVLARVRTAPPARPAPSLWVRTARPGATSLPASRGPRGWRASALPR